MPMSVLLVIAAGTFAFRFAGPLLRDRITLPDRVKEVMSAAATVLLVALVATAALTSNRHFAGWALPIGVAVGGLAAWRKAPFIVVVVIAAATTAGLRLFGVN
ncbi:branched-chain amino acid transporter [Lentzea sp. NBRC 105346]|uniref:AzlD domain-containing protein n=1 Tax=Lentzea sp. NBRC 105346 TaxID=3032205 RepID=UPI0024A602C2|nr:AzlD domain-containing protein [Lentzea sp. NBRC 105346]GLZ33532.1 branched-chain amino acid transporter [Lentzea sp. NBRC 105346]